MDYSNRLIMLSNSQFAIMDLLWSNDSGIMRKDLRSISNTRIRTISATLYELVKKDYVSVDKESHPHKFFAAITKKDYANCFLDYNSCTLANVIFVLSKDFLYPHKLDELIGILNEYTVMSSCSNYDYEFPLNNLAPLQKEVMDVLFSNGQLSSEELEAFLSGGKNLVARIQYLKRKKLISVDRTCHPVKYYPFKTRDQMVREYLYTFIRTYFGSLMDFVKLYGYNKIAPNKQETLRLLLLKLDHWLTTEIQTKQDKKTDILLSNINQRYSKNEVDKLNLFELRLRLHELDKLNKKLEDALELCEIRKEMIDRVSTF